MSFRIIYYIKGIGTMGCGQQNLVGECTPNLMIFTVLYDIGLSRLSKQIVWFVVAEHYAPECLMSVSSIA